VTELPRQPFEKQWLDAHRWWWDAQRLDVLLQDIRAEPVFFVGGAHNEQEFFKIFAKRFGLYVDTATLIRRLQPREPKRWVDGSPELQGVIDWNVKSKDYMLSRGSILIDSSMPVEEVADTILRYIQE